MPNPIKYTTGSETNALKKGNFYIGTGAVGKGPSDSTGYYQGPNVPSNGYVIYMNKDGAPGNLSYHSAANDSELISFTNSLAGQSYTGVQQCFNYYYGQTDKLLVNQDYPANYPYIVMDGLVLNLDAGITQSYPGSGTVWNDINGLGPKNNGTLINGPTFNSVNGGSIVFDGVDDYVNCGDGVTTTSTITVNSWVKLNTNNNYQHIIDSSNNSWHLSVLNDGRAYFYDGFDYQRNGEYLYTGSWYMLTGVKTLTQNIIYVNGLLSESINSNNSVPTGNIWIGRWQSALSGNRPFNGYVALSQIYNRALSATEVLQNYNAQKGRFGL
jgi:hypothetical protein